MKNVIILLVACMLLFSGCERQAETPDDSSNTEVPTASSKPEIPTGSSGEVDDMREVIFTVIDESDYIYVGPIEFPLEPESVGLPSCMQPINSEGEAREVGQTILEAFEEKGKFPDFVLGSIVHFTKDNIWRFDCSDTVFDRGDGSGLLGSVLHVAIDGGTGDIVQIWIEE